MKAVYSFLLLFVCCSCGQHLCPENDLAGEYAGVSHNRHSINLYYHLDLKDDGTCEMESRFDLYRNWGTGSWHIQGNTIVIEYENIPQDSLEELSAGRRLTGTETIAISGKNRLVLNGGTIIKRVNNTHPQLVFKTDSLRLCTVGDFHYDSRYALDDIYEGVMTYGFYGSAKLKPKQQCKKR